MEPTPSSASAKLRLRVLASLWFHFLLIKFMGLLSHCHKPQISRNCARFLPSARIKGSWTHQLCSKKSKASTDLTGSKISAPASAADTRPLPQPLALFERPKTHRTEGLNGTMVGFYQRFSSKCS